MDNMKVDAEALIPLFKLDRLLNQGKHPTVSPSKSQLTRLKIKQAVGPHSTDISRINLRS